MVNTRMLLLLPMAIACSVSQDPSDDLNLPTPNAQQVFAADLDGDGHDEIATLNDGQLTAGKHTHPIVGTVVASAACAAGNATEETLYIVTGRSRDYPNTTPTIHRITNQGMEGVYTAESKSHRISDLQCIDDRVFITLMGGNKLAQGGFVIDGVFHGATQSPMGLKQIPVGPGSTVIGRLYGDEPRSDGELVLVGGSGDTTRLPSKRGVRTLVAHDINADGHQDLLVGDGWHYQYGKRAEPTLRILIGPDFQDERLVAELPTGFTISQIIPVSGGPKGRPNRIVVLGTDAIYLLVAEPLGWKQIRLSDANQGTHIDVSETATGAKLIVSGTPIDVIPLP